MNREYEIVDYYALSELYNGAMPYKDVIEANASLMQLFTLYLPIHEIPSILKSSNVIPSCKDYLEKLFEYIYGRYYNHYIVAIPEGATLSSSKELLDWQNKFISIMALTYDKYATLIALCESYKNKYMDGIKVTTNGQVRFNDTPQDISEVSDDKFASNVTKSLQESETSNATPVERIREIEEKILNIYLRWTNEFDKIFIEEGNI